MAYQHYRSPFGDTTYTKVFVGGLAWETPTDVMRSYFEQFGEILEAVIITDKNTGKSKGYGFVTFRDPESAKMACADPNPVIDGRRANCNIASLGRPRPSPPRGRNQGGNPYHGGGGGVAHGASASSSSYGGGPATLHPPPPPPPPPPAAPVIYPPYGYATYPPDYGYQQSIYNQQLQQAQYYHPQLYGASSSSSTMGSPYYYGYSMQAVRGTFSAPSAQRVQTPSYLYYPTHMGGGSFSTYPPPTLPQPIRHPFPSSSTDSQIPQQHLHGSSTEPAEVGGINSPDSPKT